MFYHNVHIWLCHHKRLLGIHIKVPFDVSVVTRIATDVHLPVYCNAIRAGTVEDFDHALLAYQRLVGSTHPFAYSEQNMLLLSMACTDDAIVLQRLLLLFASIEKVVRLVGSFKFTRAKNKLTVTI